MSGNPEDLPRLLAFDLDGTLLPESKRITPYTRRVLDAMRQLGCQVTVATGKFHHLALQYGEALELDLPQISHDGALLGGNGHPAVRRAIPRSTVSELIERYQPESTHGFADDGADLMLLRNATSDFRTAIRDWADRFGTVDDLGEHLTGDSAILSFYCEDEVTQRIHSDATARFPELRISLYRSHYLGCARITFQPRETDKGTGVLEVARQIGAEAHECMVFGDWLNDLPMFGIGAVGVAMANAEPEVHAVATHTTRYTNEEDGAARFLEDRFLR